MSREALRCVKLGLGFMKYSEIDEMDLVTPAANQKYIYDGQYRITTSIKSVTS